VQEAISFIIVEDQAIVYAGLRASLDNFPGLKFLEWAQDGLAVVEVALLASPDVIIMDIGLPKLDGIEATRQINRKLPAIKVVILCSREEARDVLACLRAGASGYCRKEASVDELVRAMRTVTSGLISIEPLIASRLLDYMNQQQLQGTRTSDDHANDATLGLTNDVFVQLQNALPKAPTEFTDASER
jgi:NarL family two-component system response regulator LiaR